MAGARRRVEMINMMCSTDSAVAGRPNPMPRRGQVKVAIVLGLLHSFSSIFSPTPRPRAGVHLS
ncbi:hypothetical protein RGQ29_020511 [Quercus rubra]|uniref:Uncharacterized protein n=1 Tax=Quercus rubra TaxID=3512 RepID=A0AAN7FBJ3_QUERU|nr:hypothetical protein RGQ29_020511 [Quercus rubra]